MRRVPPASLVVAVSSSYTRRDINNGISVYVILKKKKTLPLGKTAVSTPKDCPDWDCSGMPVFFGEDLLDPQTLV